MLDDPVDVWLWYAILALGASIILTIVGFFLPFNWLAYIAYLAFVVCFIIWLIKALG